MWLLKGWSQIKTKTFCANEPVLTLSIATSRMTLESDGFMKTNKHTPTSCSLPSKTYFLPRSHNAFRSPSHHDRWFVVLKKK